MSNVRKLMTKNLVEAHDAKQVADLIVGAGSRSKKVKSAADIQEQVLAWAELDVLDVWAERLAESVKESPVVPVPAAPKPGKDGKVKPASGQGPWWSPVIDWLDDLDARREELVKMLEAQAAAGAEQQGAEVHQIGEAAA